MPVMSKESFGIFPRRDGQPGSVRIVPANQGFVESDGTDVRMRRAYVMDERGNVVHVYLIDPMGAPFADTMQGVIDDSSFLETID